MSHTPKPWKFSKMLLGSSKDRRSGFVVNRDHEPDEGFATRICDMRCTPEKPFTECEANARLIAAAPDLLEALQAISKWMSDAMLDIQQRGLPSREAYEIARAAIAKAKGE